MDLSRKIVSRQRTSSYDRVADRSRLDRNSRLKLVSDLYTSRPEILMFHCQYVSEMWLWRDLSLAQFYSEPSFMTWKLK